MLTTFPSLLNADDIINDLTTTYHKEEFEITLRLEGTRIIVNFLDGNSDISYSNIADKVALDECIANEKLVEILAANGKNLALVGTVVGDDIKLNNENLRQNIFFYTDIYDHDAKKYILPKLRSGAYIPPSPDGVELPNAYSDLWVCSRGLGEYLRMVPYWNIFVPFMKLEQIGDKDTLLTNLKDMATGHSLIGKNKRRGLVFKHTKSDYMFEVTAKNWP